MSNNTAESRVYTAERSMQPWVEVLPPDDASPQASGAAQNQRTGYNQPLFKITDKMSALAEDVPGSPTLKTAAPDSFDALDIRRMNRTIRQRTPQAHYDTLMHERNAIVTKEFDGGLTPKERRRLRLVRWELDCIEDAYAGGGLDRLEAVAQYQQDLSRQMQTFLESIREVTHQGSRTARRQSHRHTHDR